MTISGSTNFQDQTFTLNNIVNTNNLISITNNLLSFTYRDDQNRLVTFRKNISNSLNINKGDYLTSSNIKDINSNGGFAKLSKCTTKRKYHFAKSTVAVDWDDVELNDKYNVLSFTDENGMFFVEELRRSNFFKWMHRLKFCRTKKIKACVIMYTSRSFHPWVQIIFWTQPTICGVSRSSD